MLIVMETGREPKDVIFKDKKTTLGGDSKQSMQKPYRKELVCATLPHTKSKLGLVLDNMEAHSPTQPGQIIVIQPLSLARQKSSSHLSQVIYSFPM